MRSLTVVASPMLLIAALSVGTAWGQLAVPASSLVRTWQYEWKKTDFSRASVDLNDIISGGPPKDGIPPIDKPTFEAVAEAAKWLEAEEPVLVFTHGGVSRAYPLQILIWHEIVNDTVGGQPVVVTFCPLCNSALVFDRRVEGRVLDFGTTGKLRNSDLVMWDRQTESWWQQLTGEGIVGNYTGTRLTYLAAPLVSFTTFRESFPEGEVLSRETGHYRDYGANPYAGYDAEGNRPFLMKGAIDQRLPAMERVFAIEIGNAAKAYPFHLVRPEGVVNDEIGGRGVVILFRAGTRSALDGRAIAQSRDVGTGFVYDREVEGRRLTFARAEDGMTDRETGSRWNVMGEAVTGQLKGKSLTPLPHGQHFAFAWLAFRPNSDIWKGP